MKRAKAGFILPRNRMDRDRIAGMFITSQKEVEK